MNWNVDKALARYEPMVIPGTILQRVYLQVAHARREGLKVPSTLEDNDSLLAWSLGVGQCESPKVFIHGLSIRECFLRLRKLVKLKQLVLSKQLYPKLWKRPKPKERKRRKKVEKKE